MGTVQGFRAQIPPDIVYRDKGSEERVYDIMTSPTGYKAIKGRITDGMYVHSRK